MAEQEKDAAFWGEPVQIGLTQLEWDTLDALARLYFTMLSDLLRGEELEIPHKAAFYEFVAQREETALHAMCALAEQLHAAGVLADAELAGFKATLPARKSGELVFAEMCRQEAGALLTAIHGVVRILGRLHNHFQKLAQEELPSEPEHRKNLAGNIWNALNRFPQPVVLTPAPGEWVR